MMSGYGRCWCETPRFVREADPVEVLTDWYALTLKVTGVAVRKRHHIMLPCWNAQAIRCVMITNKIN